MSQFDLVELENYLFSENKQEFLKKLIAGTDSHNYFTLLTTFNENNGGLTPEEIELFNNYSKKFNTPRKISFQIRYLLTGYEQTQDAQNQQLIMKKINSLLNSFTWNHTQPTNITAQNLSVGSEFEQKNSVLDENLISRNNLLQGALNSTTQLSEIEPRLYTLLNPKKISESNEDVIRYFFQNVDESLASMEGVPAIIQAYRDQVKKRVPTGEIEAVIYSQLSVEQIKELLVLIPDLSQSYQLIAEWFTKEFQVDAKANDIISNNTNVTTQTREQRQKLISEMMKWTQNLHDKFNSFYQQLHYELLILGIETNQYDFQLFYSYLQNPQKVISVMNRDNQTKFYNRQVDTFWYNVHTYQVSRLDDNSLTQNYVQAIFLKSIELDQPLSDKDKTHVSQVQKHLSQFFDEKYLTDVLYRMKLYRGENIQFISEIFNSQELRRINDEKNLIICKHNQEFFVHGEQVALTLEIKNIPELIIKIFELCTENYYSKTQNELDPNMNLDGLIAVEEEVHKLTQAPVIKFKKDFIFQRISETQQGVFIIEIIGNGLCSRAIIQKGRLVLQNKLTAAGHVYRILDENLELCKPVEGKSETRCGIWVQNQFYASDPQNGEIIIPFSSKQGEHTAIIVNGEFSSISKVRLVKENYFLRCSFLYNKESFLTASVAQVIIQPRLYGGADGAAPMSLDLIKEPVITVTVTNQVGIPSTTTFDKISLNYTEDVVVDFPVPAQAASVNIKLVGNIKYMINPDQKKEIKVEHNITFDSKTGQNIFSHQNLRYTEKGYEIYVLGKNGQPKADVRLNMFFTVDGFRGGQATRNATLYTDQEGKVVLGQLKGVKLIVSNIVQKGDILAETKNWYIENITEVSYPSYIKMVTNESVNLPYLGGEISNKKLNFVQVGRIVNGYSGGLQIQSRASSVISNQINQVQLTGNSKNILTIQGLDVGYYVLEIKDTTDTQIEFEVINGKQYKGEQSLIVTEKALMDLKRTKTYLLVDEIKLSKSAEDSSSKASEGEEQQENTSTFDLTCQIISDDLPKTRVHLIATTFLNQNINDLASVLISNSLIEQSTVIPLFNSRSVYMSSKTLGDEYRYVLDRKKQTVYVGNTLDKPQLLLKRSQIRETTLNGQAVAEGSTFAQPSSAPNDQALLNHIRQIESGTNLGRARPISSYQTNIVESYLNFLRSPALVVSNLKPDPVTGIVKIEGLNLESYSTLQIITTNPFITVTQIVPLPQHNLSLREVTQMSNFSKEKFYSIFRSNMQVPEEETLVIKDLTSTEFQLVDSVSKLFHIQKELRKCFGEDSEQTGGYDFWDFLKKWDTLTLENKHQQYDKYACHELNIFIYCKDNAYFDNHVKPFISNKIEKTFVDYFLLRDENRLYAYNSPSQIIQLNALELILLIIFLVEVDQLEQARDIAQYIELQNQQITYDTKLFKKLFDTVLNAKTDDTTNENLLGNALNINNNMNNNNNNMNMNMNMNINYNMNMNRAPRAPMMQMQQQMPQQMNRMSNNMYMQVPMMANVSNNFSNAAPMPYNAYPTAPSGGAFAFGAFGAPPPPQMQQQQMQMQMNSNYDYMGGQQMEFEYDDAYSGSSNAYIEKRQGFVSQFRNVERTQEYCERQYYQQISPEGTQSLVGFNQFWGDLAKHLVQTNNNKPFMSPNFIYLAQNHTEMIAVLSFISLPFNSKAHAYNKTEGKGVEIKAGANIIAFIQEIKEGTSELKPEILVSQRFYEPNDRYIYSDEDPSIQFEKEIKEYVIDKVYGCQVIVTNCSVTRQEFQVLVEVPEGSIPVNQNDYTKSHTMLLQSFNTKTIDFYFYFPKPGRFNIYPANVGRSGTVVAVATTSTFDVKSERTVSNLETIEQILTQGSKEDILNFLSTKNILNSNIFRFNDVYYLLRDKDFYLKFIEILRKRKVFDMGVWSYSIYHGDHNGFVEYLNHNSTISLLSGKLNYFKNSIIEIHPVRVLEYYPLVNARVHLLHQDKSNILNKELRVQYKRIVEFLVEQYPNYTLSDQLALIYYLLIQDRIEQAIRIFKMITKEDIDDAQGQCLLQFDYFTAYLDFYLGYPEFQKAREISEQYLDFPVISWRNQFYDIANRLAEYDGQDKEDSKQEQTLEQNKITSNKKKNEKNSQKEQTLSITLEGEKINLAYQNLSQVQISFYLIDLEVLFSRNPFLSQDSEDFSFVIPNEKITVELKNEEGLNKHEVRIPEQFIQTNVYIRALGVSKRVSATYFSNSLIVQLVENYGQVKVFNKEEKPVSKVYVQAFAKDTSGKVTFYKDGYTDLIGRFDYASTNSGSVDSISKFAIFVFSPELGAMIKEANPPSSLGRVQTQVQLIGTKHKAQAQGMLHAQEMTYVNSRTNVSQQAWN